MGFWPFTGPVKSVPSSVLQAAVMSLESCMVDPSYQTFYKQSVWGEERGGACGASQPQNNRIISAEPNVLLFVMFNLQL